MLDKKLIGFSGFARSGKNTACEILCSILRDNNTIYAEYAFASELKRKIDPMVKSLFGFSAFTESQDEKEILRPILVAVGEAARKIDPDFWLNIVCEQIKLRDAGVKHHGVDCHMILVTDVRYENEAKRLQELGGKIIHLEREGLQPPNEEERINTPKVKAVSDLVIDWPVFPCKESLEAGGRDIMMQALKLLT
tara:strand:- start:1980 stop:2561 length:582 start_codon:yes stop_codon:yes gene_type:complete